MFFLKEQFVALLFSLLSFLVSFIAGLAHGAELYVVCIRASVLALIAYGVGWICGMLIKSLFLEALLPPPEKPKEVAAKTAPAVKISPKKD